ncbi:response regulator [Breznakiellaceae bacterium SP9]
MDKYKLLAIDDSKVDLMVLCNFLKAKYDLRVSKSASNSIIYLEKNHVDLILLDIEMPEMSGFEFLHEIRKTPQYLETPIIIVSSHNTEEFYKHAKDAGAFDVLAKPVNPAILEEKIEHAIKGDQKVSGVLADI